MVIFFYLGILLALIDWIAIARDAHSIRWLSKPGVILALLLWFATASPITSDVRVTWFILALCLSLVGDIFLLMEGYQLIKGGLAFILAHAAFIIAYNIPPNVPPMFFGIFTMVGIISVITYGDITRKIHQSGDPDLAWGIRFYALVLTGMVSMAMVRVFIPTWDKTAAWLTALGGILFYISDILLFTNRFMQPRRDLRLLLTITYHVAQFAITYGYLWFLYI